MPAFYVWLRLSAGVENIANPRKRFAVVEVVRVDVVFIGFALECVAAVRSRPVTVVDEEHEPECEVKNPLKHEPEFALL